MVIREWRGRASRSRAEAYPRHFRYKVVPELRRVPGFVGAHLSQRRFDDKVEFLVLTRWRSMDSIQAFAGPNIEKAVVEPGAVAALIEFDADVPSLRRHRGSAVVIDRALRVMGGVSARRTHASALPQ
jgi:heme-degrading monooxygenase HmoA